MAARLTELPAHRALARSIRDPAVELAPFTTDGCSGGLSAVWGVVSAQFADFAAAHGDTPPWEDCCVTHDRAYHSGGLQGSAEAAYAAREQADSALRQCVVDTGETRVDTLAEIYAVEPDLIRAAYRTIGDAMYLAVRIGGGPCSGLPWRWGYGWPQCLVDPQDFQSDEG